MTLAQRIEAAALARPKKARSIGCVVPTGGDAWIRVYKALGGPKILNSEYHEFCKGDWITQRTFLLLVAASLKGKP